jgi:hypothetical protein
MTPLSGRGLSGQDVSSQIVGQEKINQAGSLIILSIILRRMSIKNYSDIKQMDDMLIPAERPEPIKKAHIFARKLRHPMRLGGHIVPPCPIIKDSLAVTAGYFIDNHSNGFKIASTTA